MSQIDETFIDSIIADVERRHASRNMENTPRTAETPSFVDDVISTLPDEQPEDTTHDDIVQQVIFEASEHEEVFETEEPSAIEESTGLPDHIVCPECGSSAYLAPDYDIYVCDDCDWEGTLEEAEEERERRATEEQTPSAPVEETSEEAEQLVDSVLEEISEEPDIQDVFQDAIDNAVEAAASQSLLIDETTARFKGAPWYEIVQSKSVILAGLGGIGSYVNLFLARMKPMSMHIYDDDVVETVNMSGQLYGNDSFGKSKVLASIELVNKFADYYSVFGHRERFTAQSDTADIMICGFDNMSARKVFFSRWLERVSQKDSIDSKSQCLFIDGRLAAESMQVFCITGNDAASIQKYQDEWLFSDEEADATVCSYKQTTYCAAMIGSIITNLFVNFCTNLGEPIFDRSLPFLTEYDAELMQFKMTD